VFNPHDTLHNFTKAFEFRTAGQLNSTDLGLDRGYYGAIYPQSGYSVDLAPNLAPHFYAARVQACMPLMQASIEFCRRQQQVRRKRARGGGKEAPGNPKASTLSHPASYQRGSPATYS
jgi:hypothetical protein